MSRCTCESFCICGLSQKEAWMYLAGIMKGTAEAIRAKNPEQARKCRELANQVADIGQAAAPYDFDFSSGAAND